MKCCKEYVEVYSWFVKFSCEYFGCEVLFLIVSYMIVVLLLVLLYILFFGEKEEVVNVWVILNFNFEVLVEFK